MMNPLDWPRGMRVGELDRHRTIPEEALHWPLSSRSNQTTFRSRKGPLSTFGILFHQGKFQGALVAFKVGAAVLLTAC